MSQRVRHSSKHTQSTESSKRFYAGITLAVLLILGGLSALWLANQTPSSDQSAAGQLVTPAPEVMVAPDFTLRTVEGDIVKLSDYRGQVVLFNTWATWCPPCRAEMPDLEAYYREHRDDGFVVLAVNSQESASTVAKFVETQGFTFPVLLDPDGKVMSRYAVRGLPTSFVIDRDGMVRGVWSGQLSPARLREMVDSLL